MFEHLTSALLVVSHYMKLSDKQARPPPWQPQDSQRNQSHDGGFWPILRGSESGSGLTQQLHCTNNTNNTKAVWYDPP